MYKIGKYLGEGVSGQVFELDSNNAIKLISAEKDSIKYNICCREIKMQIAISKLNHINLLHTSQILYFDNTIISRKYVIEVNQPVLCIAYKIQMLVPNISQQTYNVVFEVENHNQFLTYGIVMEKIPYTLRNSSHRFNSKQLYNIFLQIQLALLSLHTDFKVSHNDVNSDNILIKYETKTISYIIKTSDRIFRIKLETDVIAILSDFGSISHITENDKFMYDYSDLCERFFIPSKDHYDDSVIIDDLSKLEICHVEENYIYDEKNIHIGFTNVELEEFDFVNCKISNDRKIEILDNL